MKKVFIILVFLLCNLFIGGQTPARNTQYDKLQTFLKNDSLAFQQFLMAKRCFCRDNFLTLDERRIGKKSNNSNKDLYELSQLLKKSGYIFFVAIDVQKLITFLNINLTKEYTSSIGRISDDGNRVNNKNILCEAISSQTKHNYNQYVSLINNLDNYARPMNKGSVFLKEETYLDNLYYYYPGKKERWYNFNNVHKVMDTE
ncbi:hypothetical protein [Chryseobacterium sp. Mn2064]|uniref:hypothetical protein n=1 Tax=Chryseobacterium sp. Mn2064 TaxID=3395263 RepID=UPI003BE5E9DF